MKIIAGLGNPGAKYDNNRHNVGFMAVDAIVRRHSSFGPWQKKFNAEMSEGRIGTEKVLCLKPLTFMNLSGQSVGEALRFYKAQIADLMVIYDELDLAPGKVRIKTGGGHGGHNGIKSIDAHCGKDYVRVRTGIGHPGDKDRVTSYVLGDFSKADQQWLDPLLAAIGDNIDLLVANDNSGFMNKLALALPGKPASDKPTQKINAAKKRQSHIHQARTNKGITPPEPKGPMADMLKKLLGK